MRAKTFPRGKVFVKKRRSLNLGRCCWIMPSESPKAEGKAKCRGSTRHAKRWRGRFHSAA